MIETTEAQMVAESLTHPFVLDALSLITQLPHEHVELAILEILDQDTEDPEGG